MKLVVAYLATTGGEDALAVAVRLARTLGAQLDICMVLPPDSGGGPLQFPPPLSERSEPLTPGSPSRLHFQDLHRFHGLRPSPPGSTLPRPTRHRQVI